jgi:hypothetical protein
MKAEALARERHVLAENAFVEIVVWRVPHPVKGSTHRFKYRLALIVAEECVLRYDNETGKGDHRHLGETETAYVFRGYERLLADFWKDVEMWRHGR